jgi:hypothetical protein
VPDRILGADEKGIAVNCVDERAVALVEWILVEWRKEVWTCAKLKSKVFNNAFKSCHVYLQDQGR